MGGLSTKTWFNGDGESKRKFGGNNRRGTLSDELNRAERIGKQLRCDEAELKPMQMSVPVPSKRELVIEEIAKEAKPNLNINEPWQPQRVAIDYEIRYGSRKEAQLSPSTEKMVSDTVSPIQANITISFDKDHTMAFNMNIESIIMILNSSGEQFDFKITNDGEGGQKLNITAPTKVLYKILALFE